MCLPAVGGIASSSIASSSAIAGISAGISALSTVMGIMSQIQTAKATAQMAQASAKSAVASYQNQKALEELRIRQEAEKVNDQKFELMLDRKRQQAKALASSQATGLSLDAVLAELERQEARYSTKLDRNLDYQKLQSSFNIDAYRSQAENRIEKAKASITPMPSIIGSGLMLVGNSLDSYTKYTSSLES
jgi:ribosome-associated translation inhibitor RaiA